jgi:hypothetical protein
MPRYALGACLACNYVDVYGFNEYGAIASCQNCDAPPVQIVEG